MQLMITHYHSAPVRAAYDVLVRVPLELWFMTLGRLGPSSTFFNYTGVPTATLAAAWASAQHSLATTPFSMSTTSSVLHAPDPRALAISPSNVTVVPVPDELISNLVKVDPAWAKDKDPSGTILDPTGWSYRTVHAVTFCFARPRVYAAASEVPTVLSYEFENIILDKLGYDVSAR